MQTIKESCCHLNKKVHLQSKMFNLYNNHNGEGTKYTLNLSSIALLSAYSLFSPEFSMKIPHFITEYQQTQKLKRPSKRKFESTLEVQWGQIDNPDAELSSMHIPFTEGSTLHSDTFGMDFLNRASSPWVPSMKQRQTDEKPKEKKHKKRKKSHSSSTLAQPLISDIVPVLTSNNNDQKEGSAIDVETMVDVSTPEPKLPRNIILDIPNYLIDRRKAISIDQAVIESITQVDCKAVRTVLYESIILIGGSSMITGLKEMLKDKLMDILPRDGTQHIEVYNSNEFFREANSVSWQGMQALTNFLQPKDFIEKESWDKKEVGALREKLHFLFDNNDNKKS
jgi:hypothetical protein